MGKEYAQDEWNYTAYSVRRHGVVGTLKNEVVGLGKDAIEVSRDAAETVREAAPAAGRLVRHGSQIVPQYAGQVSSSVGNVLHHSSRAAANAGHSVIQDQIVTPIKRAWSLLVMAFFMCFILPMFALRAYAPMNSVVSNLGLVYSAVMIACPPNFARSRRARGCMLTLWPLVLVVLPLALHFWLLHPSMRRRQTPLFPGRGDASSFQNPDTRDGAKDGSSDGGAAATTDVPRRKFRWRNPFAFVGGGTNGRQNQLARPLVHNFAALASAGAAGPSFATSAGQNCQNAGVFLSRVASHAIFFGAALGLSRDLGRRTVRRGSPRSNPQHLEV